MKKLSVLLTLAVLLSVAGTGLAVTCAFDNVPAATLLVPYFKVSRGGATGAPIPTGGTDTICAITNVSSTGVIVHITVWNKYSKPVLDFNVPLTAYDVATFSMRDILNGNLNINQTQTGSGTDGCRSGPGFGATTYRRFANPDPADDARSISKYSGDAIGSFRANVWDSLDESQDITSLVSGVAGGMRDNDNPACGRPSDNTYSGDFTGYLTLDVINFCTNAFPDEPAFYLNDAIATRGWNQAGGPGTPNVVMGDVFFVDPATTGGNISGDPMVHLEFDTRLNNWLDRGTDPAGQKTFYARYNANEPTLSTVAPAAWRFLGDGREPLGDHWGFRYLNQTIPLTTWAVVWRSDRYVDILGSFGPNNLCDWYQAGNPSGAGLWDSHHQLVLTVRDENETPVTMQGGPSGGPGLSALYVFLETQRINVNQASDFKAFTSGGWIDVLFPGVSPYDASDQYNQSYLGVQHSGPGLALSVGHTATQIGAQGTNFLCYPNIYSTSGISGGN